MMNNTDISTTLNVISEKLFKSVEGQVYEVLDNISIITPKILSEEPLKNIFFSNKINGLVIIANSLLLFFAIHYIFSQLISMFNGNKTENIYVFIIKNVIIALIINNSYYICEESLNIFNEFSNSISTFTTQLSGNDITFQNLKENIISMEDFMKNDLLSLDGIIKGVISFGSISILINFSIRYVTIIFLLLVSPLALVCLCSKLTSGITKTWLKLYVCSLFTQIFVKLIIFIPIMYKDTKSILYKIILVGSISILYKINSFTKDFFVKVTDFSDSYNIFKGK